MLDGAMMYVGDHLIYVLVAASAFLCVAVPFVMLAVIKHKGRIELDHYGKYRGGAAARSFVCPDCLHRSYAPSHIAKRWCARCEKDFPEKLSIGHAHLAKKQA